VSVGNYDVFKKSSAKPAAGTPQMLKKEFFSTEFQDFVAMFYTEIFYRKI